MQIYINDVFKVYKKKLGTKIVTKKINDISVQGKFWFKSVR